ncbi:response regulator [Roseovarius sp. S1116L3]|uniref:response regulator n=1 Tax=Roseovarius roseus TaxID=3342636 RepID=UPI00372C7986
MARILVLDNEAVIALDLSMILEDEGFSVCGPYSDSDAALAAIEESVPDGALLDVNLGQARTSAIVAASLEYLSVPFAFLTGYDHLDEKLGQRFGDRPRVVKPFDPTRVLAVVNEMLRK